MNKNLRLIPLILALITTPTLHSGTLQEKTSLIPSAYLHAQGLTLKITKQIATLITLYTYHKIVTINDLKTKKPLHCKDLLNKLNLNPKDNIVFFDIETTGLSTTNDRIVQIAFATLYPSGKIATHSMIIDPRIPIPHQASNVHRITEKYRQTHLLPTLSEIGTYIHRCLNNQIICGYNSIRFDMPLLKNECKRNHTNIPSPKQHIDVLKRARQKLNLDSYKLSNTYKAISGKKNLDENKLHDALYDTLATITILYNLELAIGNRAGIIPKHNNFGINITRKHTDYKIDTTITDSDDYIQKGRLAGKLLNKALVIQKANYFDYIQKSKPYTLTPEQWNKANRYMNEAKNDSNTPWFKNSSIFWISPNNKLWFTFGKFCWRDIPLDMALEKYTHEYSSYKKWLVSNNICTEQYLDQAEKWTEQQNN